MEAPASILGIIGLGLSILFYFLKRRKPKTAEERFQERLKKKRKQKQKIYRALKKGKLDEVQKDLSSTLDNIISLDKLRSKKNNSDK